MEPEFLSYFKHIFPRFLIYLVVPIYLGLQFSFVASDERKASIEHRMGSYALDAVGLFFALIIPVFFIVSTLAIFKLSASHPDAMAALFRYGLFFFFLGVWWQFFTIMALKAYRDRDKEGGKLRYVAFYAASAVFISLNAFLGGEWFLKWMSLIFFAMAAPLMAFRYRRMAVAFLVAAILAFIIQTIGFLYVSAIA